MALGVDVGVDPDRNADLGAAVGGDRGDAIELARRLDVDGVDARGDRERQLVARLADAGEDDVARREPGAQRNLDLTHRVRVGAAAQLSQHAEEREG